jgi:hypothetical protein
MRRKLSAIAVAALLLLGGLTAVQAVTAAGPAAAASSADNNVIADRAMAYNNRWGSAASVESGVSGYTGGAPLGGGDTMDGECRAFVNAILKLTLGINTAYGEDDYQRAFREQGGEPISATGGMRGDVIQVGDGVHTSIINRNLGGGSYEVVDSNYVGRHWVGVHAYTPPAGAQIWRMATVHVSIRSVAANRFVSSELSYTGADHGMLRARAASPGSWERFTLKGDCSRACAVRSDANGLYLTAELGYQGYAWGETRARSAAANGWEQFHFQGNCATACAIQSLASGRFITVELNYTGNGQNMLRARSTSAQAWEQFQVS